MDEYVVMRETTFQIDVRRTCKGNVNIEVASCANTGQPHRAVRARSDGERRLEDDINQEVRSVELDNLTSSYLDLPSTATAKRKA